jgi:hypothetical protein
MKVTVARVDVIYEVNFRRPLFDREREVPPLLQSLYDTLSDNFGISLSDVSVHLADSLPNVFAMVNLFGGAGSVELRLDRWRAVFRNIRTDEDRKIIIRCLNLAGGAIENFSDRSRSSRNLVNVSVWYVCDAGSTGVAKMLSQHGSSGMRIERGFLGSEEIEFSLYPRLLNKTEGWDVTFLVQRSWLEPSHLFINYSGTYLEGGRYNTIDQKADHIKQMFGGLLETLGLDSAS